MFRETQNIKDSSQATNLTLRDTGLISLSYNKTNKLIAGLYMVTDIMDKDEPMRNRLRILGTGIITDIFILPSSINGLSIKITEVLSFLDIASSVGIISQMNASILRKEFILLKESIDESLENKQISRPLSEQMTLADFMKDSPTELSEGRNPNMSSIGHVRPTHLGVQKGHTLMRAIKDMSNKMPKAQNREGADAKHPHIVGEKFDILKRERREKIVKIIRSNPNGTSIKDIISALHNLGEDMGEKTLQRELISMVRDHVLNKTGEKRWSKYFVS